ncbi:TonB-dependent receptor [Persicobacter psychrovividus]|uniref:SusC/RagA family TonB-linked outer membrane protein n=1 Tax=Persicobacter psychrovividus TaxID=387638 RepID=A0ABN6L545_9BACT|nr:SusC/RagA family TonB-linked outer membrane protein [Persicobacter psychrovividus]
MKKLMLFVLVFVASLNVFAQERIITGTVTSEDGNEAIPGVNVLLKGKATGTITDINGQYSINAASPKDVLVFSFIGLATEEVKVGSQTTINMTMTADIQQLEEVMVVAYGTAKKSQFTGSAKAIKAEAIIARQSSDVTNSLAGQLSGVQIQSSNGQPGESAKIRIRGVGSMASSNEPLIVLDGIPYDGDLSSINPQDIASLTVLKDAASNALYGARGANGVIMITTKKGKNGKAQIMVDAKIGVNNRAVPNYDVMTDPAQYYETFYKTLYNAQISGGATPAEAHQSASANLFDDTDGGLGYQVYTVPNGEDFIGMDGKLNPHATLGYSDGNNYFQPDSWEKEGFRSNAVRREYNMSIAGAAKDQMNFYLSLGYLNDEGIAPGSGFERYTGRIKADYQAKKWVKFSANIGLTHYDKASPSSQTDNSSSGNLFYVANMMAPIYPLYVRNTDQSIAKDKYGYTVYDFGDGSAVNAKRPFMSMSNPASMMELDDRRFVGDGINARGSAQFTITEDLNFSANFGADVNNERSHYLYNAFYGQYAEQGGLVTVSNRRRFGVTQQYLLNYSKSFGLHNLEFLAGYEQYAYKYQYLNGSKTRLFDPHVPELDNGILEPQSYSNTDTYATAGYLSRIQYDYDGKYFASVSYRRDASSRFAPKNRWGNFYSAGMGWLLTKEDFMANLPWVDMLKFKASYGQQGNDKLLDRQGYNNYYPFEDQYQVIDNGGDFATTLTYKGNPDITWETSHSFNTGFDFDLFDGKLGGTFEYFSRITSDMLYYQPVSPSLGYSFYPVNIGSMQNHGLELDLTASILKTSKVDWDFNFNATHLQNKILKLEESLGGSYIDGSYIYEEGRSQYRMYIREYAGVDHETGKALWYKDEQAADGSIARTTTDVWSSATQYGTEDMLPKVYGGFGTTVRAFNFDFTAGFAYQLGGKIYDSSYRALMHVGRSNNAGTNFHKDILNAWTPENKSSNIPRLNNSDLDVNSSSTRFLVSSDYLSVANLSLGYTFPKKITDKMGLTFLRAYVVADNVAMWTARKGLDPRQSFTSSGSFRYSPIRSVSGGVTVKF